MLILHHVGLIMKNKVRNYNKYEFCKDVKCIFLIPSSSNGQVICQRSDRKLKCVKTAKDFHTWLNENNFFILKQTEGE